MVYFFVSILFIIAVFIITFAYSVFINDRNKWLADLQHKQSLYLRSARKDRYYSFHQTWYRIAIKHGYTIIKSDNIYKMWMIDLAVKPVPVKPEKSERFLNKIIPVKPNGHPCGRN